MVEVGAGMTVEVLLHQRLGLPDEGRQALAIAPVQHGISVICEPERCTGPVAEVLAEGDGLLEGCYRPFVVLLEEEDEAEPVERLCPDGGEATGVPLQRRLQPHLAFFETPPAPEPPQRCR